MQKNFNEAEIEQLTRDFNAALKAGELNIEPAEKQDEFCQACDNYYSKIRYREYSTQDMEPRTFHKNLCNDKRR